MAPRAYLMAIVVSLLTILVLGITACGSPAAAPTTTTTPTLTTAPVATVSTAGTGTTAGGAIQDDYKTKMAAWVTGTLEKLDTTSLNIADPSSATAEQIDAVAAFMSQAQVALDRLKAIQPSPAAAEVHNQFVKAYEDLLTATGQYVSAMRSKSISELSAAGQAMTAAQQEIQQSVNTLAPMIGLAPPTT